MTNRLLGVPETNSSLGTLFWDPLGVVGALWSLSLLADAVLGGSVFSTLVLSVW